MVTSSYCTRYRISWPCFPLVSQQTIATFRCPNAYCQLLTAPSYMSGLFVRTPASRNINAIKHIAKSRPKMGHQRPCRTLDHGPSNACYASPAQLPLDANDYIILPSSSSRRSETSSTSNANIATLLLQGYIQLCFLNSEFPCVSHQGDYMTNPATNKDPTAAITAIALSTRAHAAAPLAVADG